MAGKVTVTLEDFEKAVESHTYRADPCGREYIAVKTLCDWLEAREGVGQLLDAAYGNDALPLTSQSICVGDRRCLRVFCVLLQLRRANLIDRFHKKPYLVDTQFPKPLQKLRRDLQEGLNLSSNDDLPDRFDELQWRYWPATFDLDRSDDWPRQWIIPICKQEEIESGGTASVLQIEVQEEFVGKNLRDVSSNSRYDNPADNYGYRYQFALKFFQSSDSNAFINEIKAFHRLRSQPGMIKHLGSYSLYPTKTERVARNILLEFGERDLEEYFFEMFPPVLQIEIEQFWRSIRDVVNAVKDIHNGKDGTDGRSIEIQGLHNDIKPENILSVKGKLKLSDLGFATIVIKEKDKEPVFSNNGGTRAYSAPECSGRQITQAVDIWALGCTLSMVATWVVLGAEGVRQFMDIRSQVLQAIKENSSVSTQDYSHHHENLDNYGFHDGRKVLDCVNKWHEYLRSALRKTDTITGEVLDLIDKHVLVANPKDRLSAEKLSDHLDSICKHSRKEPETNTPNYIIDMLQNLDRDLADKRPSEPTTIAKQENLEPPMTANRQAKKSAFLRTPMMKTSHRSEYRPQSSFIPERKTSSLAPSSPQVSEYRPSILMAGNHQCS